MAQGLSTHWRKDGPISRVSQARFLAAQAKAACTNEDKPREQWCYCFRHGSRGCPEAAR